MGIRVDTSGLEALIEGLKKAQIRTNEACIRAVNETAPILKKSLQEEVKIAAHKGYATGALEKSISAMEAKENEYGVFTAVGPQGEDEKGVSNADKLLWLENGTMRKGTNLMKRVGPVRATAVRKARGKCEKAIQQNLENFFEDTLGG